MTRSAPTSRRSFVARVLVVLIFLGSAFDTISNFGPDGGPAMPAVKAKLALLYNTASSVELVKIAMASVPAALVPTPSQLLMSSAIVQVFGAVLFLLDFALGARLLALFLVVVTPVMHTFWSEPANSYAQSLEYINFLKNCAILGGLLNYVHLKKQAVRAARAQGRVKQA